MTVGPLRVLQEPQKKTKQKKKRSLPRIKTPKKFFRDNQTQTDEFEFPVTITQKQSQQVTEEPVIDNNLLPPPVVKEDTPRPRLSSAERKRCLDELQPKLQQAVDQTTHTLTVSLKKARFQREESVAKQRQIAHNLVD